jgi:hypothetical protein
MATPLGEMFSMGDELTVKPTSKQGVAIAITGVVEVLASHADTAGA